MFAVEQESRMGGFCDLARQKSGPVVFLESVGVLFGLIDTVGDNHNLPHANPSVDVHIQGTRPYCHRPRDFRR